MLKILQNCTIHSELKFKYLLYQFESRSVHSVIALDYQLAEAIKEAADARVRIDCVFCLHLGLRGTGPIHCPNVSDYSQCVAAGACGCRRTPIRIRLL
jgi:hypothetical protein